MSSIKMNPICFQRKYNWFIFQFGTLFLIYWPSHPARGPLPSSRCSWYWEPCPSWHSGKEWVSGWRSETLYFILTKLIEGKMTGIHAGLLDQRHQRWEAKDTRCQGQVKYKLCGLGIFGSSKRFHKSSFICLDQSSLWRRRDDPMSSLRVIS